MIFDWDGSKEQSNRLKHGISFVSAIRVFLDPNRVELDVTKPEYGERRFKAIGRVESQVIAVIYTDRADHRRIISARRAKRNERRQYDQSAPPS